MILEEDQAAIAACLHSGWIAAGPEIAAFEAEFELAQGGGKACVVSSGTAALFLALKALDVGPGTKVALPTYACSSLLNAVFLAGGSPVVLDVRADDFCLDADAAADSGAKIAVAVHSFGCLSDIAAMKAAGLTVIEDCCHVLGGVAGGEGSAAIFSFYATKIITCGHGGLVWDHTGRVGTWVADYIRSDGRETYKPRFNFQLSDFQGAMLRRQFGRLPTVVARRRAIAARYAACLPDGVRLQRGLTEPSTMPYRFTLTLPDAGQRDRLQRALATAGIATIVPIERFELLHRYLQLPVGAFPNAERLADTTLSLPLYPALTDQEVDRISDALAGYSLE